MFVQARFKLPEAVINELKGLKPNFGYGAFSEIIFYRTYSRTKDEQTKEQESWSDVVIRCIEGCLSIRKDWYLKNRLSWDEDFWHTYSHSMALSLFNMEWLPAGRGLWAMGSDFVYERGSMGLFNCAYVTLNNITLSNELHWLMDALMCGVGVGFTSIRDDSLELPESNSRSETYTIPDTREGWCDSVKKLIDHHMRGLPKPVFDYSVIRPEGLPIKGFGGLSSGPEPLKKLHNRIDKFFDFYRNRNNTQYLKGYGVPYYDTILLKTDLANCIGCCVVAGNVRRSAEIALGNLYDYTFVNLKNYSVFPYRTEWSWMSNNTVYLETNQDYDNLNNIAESIKINGEPGVFSLVNSKHGRVGKYNDNLKVDKGTGLNPCGEIILENYELCNLAETLPTNCANSERWFKACEYATVYTSSVALLPTHRAETNAVIMRNRRIGVSIIDITGWMHNEGRNKVISLLKKGYKIVRQINKWLADEAGVPESIRVTTVKPGGTTPKLAGKTSGVTYPSFRHTLRRIRISKNSPLVPLMIEANIPYENDFYSDNTLVFEYPIIQGPAKPATEASLWEQANNLIMLQREWADNAVSNTLTFKPKWVKIVDIYYKSTSRTELNNLVMKYNIDLESVVNYSGKWETNDTKVIYNDSTDQLTIYKYNHNHEEDIILDVLASICPHIKSASLLPETNEGVYKQMPESGITEREYNERITKIKEIDWSKLKINVVDTESEKYCSGGVCEVKLS